ncbi:efflux RND transporter periplasmic adaptor subunit (plasmid) [Caballeronia sp. NK8]|nr:efflux RND transporter periplasmic adaptor subunit [Caballeronia sp. NK8]BCQ28806.1 efflux RND transporter periplasmic adaptor subunit [Caballeronia sp. NK8]
MRIHRIWYPPLIGLVAALSLTACSKPAPQDPRTEVPLVAIATVAEAGDVQRSFTGVVAARYESDIGFRVGGKVIQRLVDIGQHVVRGQVLMRLDPTDLALGSAAQQNEVEAARAKSVQANADLKRLAGLVEQGAVSAQQYDQAVAAQKNASAQLNAALAQEGVAKNADRYTVLVSDVDGIVTNTFADPGRVVIAGQTVVAIARDGQREAAVDLPENVRPALGTVGVASVYGVDQKSIAARLRELSSSASLQTRTYAARFVLEGADNPAPLGATVTVRLSEDSTAGQVTLPVSALYDPGTGPGVWLLDTKTSTIGFRAVKVGTVGEEEAHIVAGLRPGDQVVALGAHLLHDGEKVRVTPSNQQHMLASSDGDAK